MTEWTVIIIIVTLASFAVTIIKPVISLTKSITKLNVTVQQLQENIKDDFIMNTKSHDRLWEHNKEQDNKIIDFDKRITKLEK